MANCRDISDLKELVSFVGALGAIWAAPRAAEHAFKNMRVHEFVRVDPDSPAARGGITVGDQVLSVDGQPASTMTRSTMVMHYGH
jgi:C-terminal processing protease CtpA/Prc